MIRISFAKFTTKLKVEGYIDHKTNAGIKSRNYRKYNVAFYEEMLIDYNVEKRMAFNFRERFIITHEEISLVLEMYAKNDYHEQFLTTKTENVKKSHFKKLFQLAL